MPKPLLTAERAAAQLGCLIRDTRIALGLRQEDLARQADIATSSLRRIESGHGKGPNVFVTLRLFRTLGLHIDRLTELMTAVDAKPLAEPRQMAPASNRGQVLSPEIYRHAK